MQKDCRERGRGKLAAEYVNAAVREERIDCCARQSCESDETPPKGGCGIVVGQVTSALALPQG